MTAAQAGLLTPPDEPEKGRLKPLSPASPGRSCWKSAQKYADFWTVRPQALRTRSAHSAHGENHPPAHPASAIATAASQRRLVAGIGANPAQCDRLPREQPVQAKARPPSQKQPPHPHHIREI